MKTAILVNGLYQPSSQTLGELIDNIEKVFPDTDVYFHTWEEYLSDIPKSIKVESCPEPIIHYDTLLDTKTPDTVNLNLDLKSRRETLRDHKRYQNSSKQIIGYADLYEKVSDGYDTFIRLRWDTLIDTEIDFSSLLKKCKKKPIGFMTGKAGLQGNLKRQAERRSTDFLPDQMIFHHKDHFDPQLVHELHRSKKLLPSEWGYWQVLCRPHNLTHIPYEGGATIARRYNLYKSH